MLQDPWTYGRCSENVCCFGWPQISPSLIGSSFLLEVDLSVIGYGPVRRVIPGSYYPLGKLKRPDPSFPGQACGQKGFPSRISEQASEALMEGMQIFESRWKGPRQLKTWELWFLSAVFCSSAAFLVSLFLKLDPRLSHLLRGSTSAYAHTNSNILQNKSFFTQEARVAFSCFKQRILITLMP